jgi:glucosamine--fructose-6-phosphate aminotransferase (isomerizing)
MEDYRMTSAADPIESLFSSQAKKRLIATHPNSEIAPNRSKHKASLFLTATRILFLFRLLFAGHGPGSTVLPTAALSNGRRRRRPRGFASRQRPEGATLEFKFEAEQPIEMEFFGGQPFFELFATGRFELDHHFSFLHIHQDATRRHSFRREQSPPEIFSTLPRQAGQRVLRDVTRHRISKKFLSGSAASRRQTSGYATSSDANPKPSDTLAREKKQMPDRRSAHPYYLYDAIQAQPALIEKMLARRTSIERAADAIAEKERITFVGIGTSLHAVQIAEIWMREFTAGKFLALAEQSFELVHHPIAFSRNDAVIMITHTGTTTFSVEALRAARAAGALTIAITGEMSGEGVRGVDFQIETCEQEISFAYTKSYTTALVAIALLILRIAERRKLLASAGLRAALERVPNLMRQALTLEPQVREFAKRAAPLARMWLFGSGAGWATAREAALKIKESCYLAAEGFETEEILHGPFSEVDSRGSLVGLLSGKSSDDRARQILRAGGELKMLRAAIVTQSANRDISAEHIFVVPESDEWLAAFVHLVPLQLLTYFIALERGTNPDTGRQEQPAHAATSRHYKY